VIVDYGAGNLRSMMNKLQRLGVPAVVSSKPAVIQKADKLILPGVGFFATGMANLKRYGLIEVLNQKVLVEKTPILGVCLGMQLFSQKSEEGNAAGLGWIDGEVKRFDFPKEKLKIPHIGWNDILVQKKSPLLSGVDPKAQFYFVHSYHLVCQEQKDILAKTDYGYDFVSMVAHDNIFGTQFHPEKSHSAGIKIIQNFIQKIERS